jgi:N-methylhydantoinase B
VSTATGTTLDPITIEVVANRFREIAATMEHALYHSGYSPILRESKDGTAGLTDGQGRVIIVSGGLQYHSLGYERAVRSVLARYPREQIRPGDSFIVNDPYLGGNPHAPDMVAVTPGFVDGEIICFGVSIAHKADIGGIVPGSSGAAAREIYHDGLLIPPVRYQTDAGIDEIVEAIIRSNSRTPDVVLGDLRAQVGCTRLGIERLAGLCAEYGTANVVEIMAQVLARTAQRVRDEIAAFPDGTAEVESFLDHDGADMNKPTRLHVVVEKRGDRLRIDFTGSAPQAPGPVNVGASTALAGVLLAVIAATDPTIPVNSGLTEPVEVILPEGSIVNPRHPATVNLYAPTLFMLYAVVLSALGKLLPERAVAPGGFGIGAMAIGYRTSRSGKPAVQYELLISALGGTSTNDGTAIVQPMNHMTPGTPIEVLESEYPIRVRAYDVRCDSAGAGTFRGGVGYVREYELLADCILTSRTTNHKYTAWGLNGGGRPAGSSVTLNPGPAAESLPPLFTRSLTSGAVLRLEQSAGGGYGPPFARDPQRVADDVRNGYVSAAGAAEVYGVVIDPQTLTVDRAATAAARRSIAPPA